MDGPFRLAGARRRMIRRGWLLVVGWATGYLLLGLAILVTTVGFCCPICTTEIFRNTALVPVLY